MTSLNGSIRSKIEKLSRHKFVQPKYKFSNKVINIIKMFWWRKKLTLLPAATGPFVPGCSDVMLGYGKDGMFFRLYYPTNAPKGAEHNSEKRFNWLSTDFHILIGIAKVFKLPYFLIRLVFWWIGGSPLVPALYGEKIRTTKNMKCIIFSHGLGGYRQIYSKICYDLASHGYLIACLEHRDLSCLYTYFYDSKENAVKDKRTHIKFQHFPLGGDHLKVRKDQIEIRTADCIKAIEFFKKLNLGVVPDNVLDNFEENKKHKFKLDDLVGNIDVKNFTIMGHSFGAATALATLPRLPEIRQCIALDPWMYPIKDDHIHEKVNGKPLLFINTETFHIAVNVNGMSKFMSNEDMEMYTICKTTHEYQTDCVMVAGSWLNLFMKKINPIKALKINNALIIRFLHEHVGVPKSAQEYERYLEEASDHFELGLTKPWP